jgi:hypothetical protein
MGSGSFDASVYATASSTRKAKGIDDFAYSTTTHSLPKDKWKIHATLDPKKIKGTREARDSDEHPETVPCAVIFDVTGSMGTIPRMFQEKLPKLMTLLTTKGGLDHPQVCFGAVGDLHTDTAPFQIGQFESDNRCDEQLRDTILEGGGGGQQTESYELAYYFAGWKTTLDSMEKRGKKGYLFTLGDEAPYPGLQPDEIKQVFGDKVSEPISTKDLLAKAQESFEVFHIHVLEGSYPNDPRVLTPWRTLLGERFLELADQTLVCELIAATVALLEGADWKDIDAHLGLDASGSAAVSSALATVRASAPAKTMKAEGALPAPRR